MLRLYPSIFRDSIGTSSQSLFSDVFKNPSGMLVICLANGCGIVGPRLFCSVFVVDVDGSIGTEDDQGRKRLLDGNGDVLGIEDEYLLDENILVL